VQPTQAVSVLAGIRARLGAGVQVEYAPGVDPVGTGALLPGLPAIPAACFALDAQGPVGSGLRVEYWGNPRFEGEPLAVRTEGRAELCFGFNDIFQELSAASPKLPKKPQGLQGPIAVRWQGVLHAPASGEYALGLTCLGTAQVRLDGQVVIQSAGAQVELPVTRRPMGLPPEEPEPVIRVATAKVQLEAGRAYGFAVEYAADAPGFWVFGEAMLRVGWQMPEGAANPTVAEAAALAGQMDAAVVVVRTFEMEENDRPSIKLPNEQDGLIRAVAAANPRTVVVLMNAGPVEVASWEGNVAAILEAWFAGQEQGNAVARVLFGDVNPGGRLPISFPKGDETAPLARPAGYPGVEGVLRYDEGTAVGYRGYERLGIAPQYPFGHGLSYTTFEYANLRVAPAASGGSTVFEVTFDLANTGARAGTEVAQVYVAGPATEGLKRLAGWARVSLAPGEHKQVRITLDTRSEEHPFSHWDSGVRGWRVAGGEYQVSVGASARDLHLVSRIKLPSLNA
jgi:beta-glucosidase